MYSVSQKIPPPLKFISNCDEVMLYATTHAALSLVLATLDYAVKAGNGNRLKG